MSDKNHDLLELIDAKRRVAELEEYNAQLIEKLNGAERRGWEAARKASSCGGNGGQLEADWTMEWDTFEEWKASNER